MSAVDRHPDAWVETRLRALRSSGWKVVRSKHGTFYDITCKAGTMNVRISAKLGKNKKNRTARQDLADFLIRHQEKHPSE